MTKKLTIGVLVASLLLLLNLVFAGDRSLKVPETVNKDEVSSDCSCLRADLTQPSSGKPQNKTAMKKKGNCVWHCEYFWFLCLDWDGRLKWCWDYECVWECNGLPTPR